MARGGSVGLDQLVVACNSMYSQPVKPSTASVCSKYISDSSETVVQCAVMI